MTCGRGSVPVCIAALVFCGASTLFAQTKPTPTPPPSGSTRIVTQGFSVVLVLADLQGSATQDDVPPAAKRALADMKDFLPYKAYRLIDAAWILGQGSSGSVTRLRGPEDQEYELGLYTSARSRGVERLVGQSGQVEVHFTLSEVPREGAATTTASSAERARTLRELESEIARLQKELAAAERRRDVGTSDDSAIRALRSELSAARSRLSTAHAMDTIAHAQAAPAKAPSRKSHAIIQTSFSMEVGETVVVGTSRLRGNTRALIALLTAVPSRTSRQPEPTPDYADKR